MGTDSPLTTVKGIGSDPSEANLDAAEAFFRTTGAARATFELTPWSSPETQRRLAGRGYTIVDHEDIVVCRPPYPATEPLHSVSVVQPDGWPELQLQVNDAPESEEWRTITRVCASLPGAIHFGIRGGEGGWISGGQLVPTAGIGMLANDATSPAARRTGAQTAVILARLRMARSLDLPYLMAEVAPGSTSERNYLRCGFTIAYSRVHYALSLEEGRQPPDGQLYE